MNFSEKNCIEIIELSDDEEKENFFDINFIESPQSINLLDSSTELVDINLIDNDDDDDLLDSLSVHSSRHIMSEQIQLSECSSHSEDSIMYDRLTKCLNKPIGKSNKGYKLIQKMGYKEGEKIGRNNKGLDEPINVLPFVKKINKIKKNNFKKSRDNSDEENKKEESLFETLQKKIQRNLELNKKFVNYLDELIKKINNKIIKINFLKGDKNCESECKKKSIKTIKNNFSAFKVLTIKDYIEELRIFIDKILDAVENDESQFEANKKIFEEISYFLKYTKIDKEKIYKSAENYNAIMNSNDYLECHFEMINILYKNSKFYELKFLN
jgi:hypothetical protein